MKKISLSVIACLILSTSLCFAQSNSSLPQPPAAWVTFQQQENAKRQAFFQQMAADRKAFLASNPEVATYLQQVRTAAQARMAAWRSAHPPKNALSTPAL